MGRVSAQNPPSIQKMFSEIAGKYDLANSILSFGIHHYWKKLLIKKSKPVAGYRILDCATGTGDLAFLFEKETQGKAQVIGVDFCEPMLSKAKAKAEKRGSTVRFEWADVMNLPYADEQFNVVSISFGIRNVANVKKAIAELGRITLPGGQIFILEFGKPQSRMMSYLFGFYSNWILPALGGLISGKPTAYRYLQTSSAAFPCGQAFLGLAKDTYPFSKLEYQPLQGGIAYLYTLTKGQTP